MSDSVPAAYWSDEYECWFVPVSPELLSQDKLVAEPVRLEIRNGTMWITQLETTVRRYACGLDADAEVTCDRCPDPDGCIDAA